ncbi:MAG: YgiQ family radical SAM protein, partial [Vallitaleaceae bacterium]|nr:YgiQ family radical SAM protein [Vallitaleaceae bacterium]
MNRFLPVQPKDMEERGWEELDFVLVSGDAYVDHPSFGAAIIGRLLEAQGYRIGIIAQPDWKKKESISRLGKPRLAFLVTGGNIDSMVNHYSVAKKKRDKDSYSEGGDPDRRPDRATIVYSTLIRQSYKDVPIILGGIEASLRRLAHYDYWDNKIRRSILLDANADLLVYGMGEKAIIEIADALQNGIPVSEITYVKGTLYKTKDLIANPLNLVLPKFMDVKTDKLAYAKSFALQTKETNFASGRILIEEYDTGLYVVQNLPMAPVSAEEFDSYYDLPYCRAVHPMYTRGVPAIEEVKFSLISNRGCFGNCNFCALTFHQGRTVQARSHDGIMREAKLMIEEEDFKGYIHDVGGPTANFRKASCSKQLTHGVCKEKDCLGVDPCSRLEVDHSDYLALLRKLRELPKVKKVFVRSGIRFDYLMYDKDDEFFHELVKNHISGQLKVAPEHVSNRVLKHMGKPYHKVYRGFVDKYKKLNDRYGMKQFIVPYLMSSHPGSDLTDAIELAEFLRDENIAPQQVQDFYPTPSTISTVMYYAGVDPRTMEAVYVAKTPHEKAMQRALIQYRNTNNYHLVQEALHIAGRDDLIGFDKKCLIRP